MSDTIAPELLLNPEHYSRGVWVNRSNYTINIYGEHNVTMPGGGGNTVSDPVIGRIYPNEFFVTFPLIHNTSSESYIKVGFRNSNGVAAVGYIEPRPGGYMTDLEPWKTKLMHYCDYNSNGYSLVNAKIETIDGSNYAVFTVKKQVDYIDRYTGRILGYLKPGDKIATNQSTPGEQHWDYMLFNKKKLSGESEWSNMGWGTHAFVNLGFHLGTEPATRAIW